MNFTLTFLSLYLISMAIGRKVKLPSVITETTVLVLIFTISYWGGVTIPVNEIASVLLISLIMATLLILITYVIGLFFIDKVHLYPMKVNLRMQIKYVIPLVLGLILGLGIRFELPFTFIIDYELYFLAVIIGIEIGRSFNIGLLKRTTALAILAVTVDVVGAIILSVIFSPLIPLKASLMITLGSGWYSYTGPFVAKYFGPALGVVGFLSNFLREQLAFILLPILLRVKATPIGAIAIGGATSMDVTLPLYVDLLGGEYAVGAMISGFILTLLIPIILPTIALL
ncbi:MULTISPECIES: lysine exporter LysO family protein [unclassified Stygiolobus]|uniref:lysine exporter LysO family protein n=1 Tax=unclassified Stygiolobus TaxID=2824672 RepID=UPI00307F9D18